MQTPSSVSSAPQASCSPWQPKTTAPHAPHQPFGLAHPSSKGGMHAVAYSHCTTRREKLAMTTPLFQARHYEWLAARLGACCEDQENLYWIAERFAADLAVDNPRFQPDRFLER